MSTTVHENSRAAYHTSGDTFSERERAIMTAVRELGGRATDRQIKDRLGFTDMNAVRPRVTELVKRGVLVETDSADDAVTGKRVRVVRIVEKQGELSL